MSSCCTDVLVSLEVDDLAESGCHNHPPFEHVGKFPVLNGPKCTHGEGSELQSLPLMKGRRQAEVENIPPEPGCKAKDSGLRVRSEVRLTCLMPPKHKKVTSAEYCIS